MRPDRSLPKEIAGITVPQDGVSLATWRRAQHSLPGYLLAHSVRSYCWGAGIAAREGWSFDRRILWTASLLHDAGLTTIPRNESCFEVEGGRAARRFLEGAGLPVADAARVERAIVLHMQPAVTLDAWRGVGPARSRHRARRSRGRVRAGRRHPAGRRPCIPADGDSTGGSWPRSPARQSVARPARARACCTTRGWPPGWPGRHGGTERRTRHDPGDGPGRAASM